MKNSINKNELAISAVKTETRPKSIWEKGLSKKGLGRSFWANRSGLFKSSSASGLWAGGL